MKKLRFFSLFLFVGLSVLTSCDTEPVDSNLYNDNPNNENPGDDDDDDNPGGGTADGDYWPLALNNQWLFESDEPQNDNPMKIIGTETIDGNLYYKVNYAFQDSGTDDLTGTAVIYFRKDGDSYSQRVEVTVPDEDGIEITTSPYELTLLKAGLDAGQSWTQNVTQVTSYNMPDFPVDMPDAITHIDLTGTIIEKGVSLTVGTATYNDVIKVKLVQDISTEAMGVEIPGVTTTTYIWFAKNVGPIRSISSGGGIESQSDLVSYIIN